MIHPTAIVETSGILAEDVEIGPYAIIQGAVTIGAGCRIAAQAQLLNRVDLGDQCTVGPGTIIGTNPQDLGFDPETDSGVRIGSHNVIREHVTIHRSTRPREFTRIGEHNYLMTGAHVGHDSVIGDRNIIANNCMIAGCVTVGNRTFLGGGSGFHQFVRVGDLAMAQGNAGFSTDLPPFVIGCNINEITGLNRVGLNRAGIGAETIREIQDAFKLCYRDGLNLSQALDRADQATWKSIEAKTFFDFFRAKSRKGICLRLSARRR